MRYKGIIFDLDGVICKTDEYHFRAWKTIADQLQSPFDEEKNNLLRGVSRMESLEIILGANKLTADEKISLASEKNEVYKKFLYKMTSEDLDQRVKETLDELRRRGLKLAIGSSSKNARLILSRIGLEDYFDVVVDGTDIKHSKPHPEVFVNACKQLLMIPKECAVVEDAVAGLQAGIAGGFDVIAIGDAGSSELTELKINKFEELLHLI